MTSVQVLCKHKISLHSATASHSYLIIRLPREFAPFAGETAQVYQTEQDGKLAFVVAVDKPAGKLCANEGGELTLKHVYLL